MQQTQTRSHALTRRCGKRLQRVARTVVVRLGKRGTCVVAVVAAVLLLLAVLAWTPTPPPHHGTSAETRNAAAVVDHAPPVAASLPDTWLVRPDGHGGSVRVVVFMVSTHIDESLCYALASAYFVDLPVVAVGYGTTPFVNAMKPSLFLDAVQRAGLRDSDVVMLLDTDILFSGEDMLPFIDDYIARSPADASELDVRAVRAGTALAPSLYEAQLGCWYINTYGRNQECEGKMKPLFDKIAAYVSRTGVKYYLPTKGENVFVYLNSGNSIHRVWSLRELLQSYIRYTATHEPTMDRWWGWHDDQSVFMLFYNELRVWEVEHDTLRNATAAATLRSPHGLRAGQLQLEHTDKLATGMFYSDYVPLQLTDRLWLRNEAAAKLEQPLHNANTLQYADDVWRLRGGNVRMQQRTLTRSRNATHTIDVAPPLLMLKPRRIHVGDAAAVRVAPLIIHLQGPDKHSRWEYLLPVLPWYVPMRHDAAKWQQGREHVLSSLIELWTSTNVAKRVRYGDVCQQHHPFLTSPPL